MKKTLDYIIPIYNEEACINELIRRLINIRKKEKELDISFIFINDGSRDKSILLLNRYADKYKFVKVLDFSRNFGHQFAVTAGIDYCNADYALIIDADLQDPPELVAQMYKKAKEGYDVVYGQRVSRKGETLFKKVTAAGFYRILSRLCDVKIPVDTGDFRLINKKVINAMKSMKEKHRFLRGMVPWVGFKSTALRYHRKERFAGTTKYPLKKMLKFATDAILSFSNMPLRISIYFGLLVMAVGFLLGLFMIYIKFFTNKAVAGLTVMILSIIILGGVQIFMIGLVGEYIARIFEESKNRPLYIINNTRNIKEKDEKNRE